MRSCPRCGSISYVKNGSIHAEKQKYHCCACGRHYIDNPMNLPLPAETKQLIDKLLLEKNTVGWDNWSNGCFRMLVAKICQ